MAKLRHLLVAGRQLNGNFDLLWNVIGDEQVDTDIQPGFPLKDLTKPENFLSLLHYFGLLSIRDVEVFSVNLFRFEQLMMAMANRGEWRPVLEFLSEAIAQQTGIRDCGEPIHLIGVEFRRQPRNIATFEVAAG